MFCLPFPSDFTHFLPKGSLFFKHKIIHHFHSSYTNSKGKGKGKGKGRGRGKVNGKGKYTRYRPGRTQRVPES
jgi:hypothetical protein